MSFEKECAEQLINKMFSDTSFSICDLDKLGDLLKVNVKAHPNYTALRALHCVKFSEMSDGIIKQLEAKVAECLMDRRFNPAALASLVTAEGSDFVFTEDRYIDQPKKNENKVIGFFKKS